MAAASESLCDGRDVELAFASQANAKTAIGQLAEKCRNLDILDRECVVYQAFAVFLAGTGGIHLLLSDGNPCQSAIAVEVRQGRAQQAQFGGGMGEIHVAGTVRGIGPGQHQLSRQRKGALAGAFEHERASVCEYGGVKAGCNLRGDLHPSLTCEKIDHFGGGDGLGIDPVHVGEGAATEMVVDADQEVIFESGQAGALNTVTFENDGGFKIAVDVVGVDYGIGEGQGLIDAGNTVAQDNFGVFAHEAQNLCAGQS